MDILTQNKIHTALVTLTEICDAYYSMSCTGCPLCVHGCMTKTSPKHWNLNEPQTTMWKAFK